ELDRTRARALARYAELAGTGRASSQPAEVLSAAHSGRVDVLFVPVGVQHWGVFRPEDGSVELSEPEQPGGEDLLNLAAVHTVLNRGTVYAVDAGSMPDGALLAAVYRY
ncbi:MAG TPA: hypothetical protein VFP98_04795, partial [Candidatus Polarisedimenticolia bacterium]|nr:hypothetical protein [Candidatus Polarisedimenticolia bacterium]